MPSSEFAAFAAGFAPFTLRFWPRFFLRVSQNCWRPDWPSEPFFEEGLYSGRQWQFLSAGIPIVFRWIDSSVTPAIELLSPVGSRADDKLAEALLELRPLSVSSGVFDAVADGRFDFGVDLDGAPTGAISGPPASIRLQMTNWVGQNCDVQRIRSRPRSFVMGPEVGGYRCIVEEVEDAMSGLELAASLSERFHAEFLVVRESGVE